MKNIKQILIGCGIILISFFIVIGFVYLNRNIDLKSFYTEEIRINVEPEYTIDELITDLSFNKEVVAQRDLSSRYSFLLVNGEDGYLSYVIDKKNISYGDFKLLLKNNKNEEFLNKVYELLYKKYPSFIADELKNENVKMYYDIYDNEVIIYFDNYSFNLEYTDTISIEVNYNEIKDYLNFAYQLDDSYKNEDGFEIDYSKKHIAFTFDDGPGGDTTKSIVNSLISNKSKATFFMIGNKLNNYRDTVLYVYTNGMEIGSHTYSHKNMKDSSVSIINDEINKSNNIFKNITGTTFKLLRPPYGAYTKDELNSLNYPFIIWNIDTDDWRFKNTDRIVDHILSNACDGCIVLMHDVYDTTAEAVKKVLPELYSRGYQIVSVSQLASIKGKELKVHNVYGYIK